MVQWAEAEGVSATARAFHTTRNTVRKWNPELAEGWLTRYKLHGTRGLKDLSRAPKRSPKKIPATLEGRILAIRRRLPTWGPRRLKMDFAIPCSPGAIYRVIKQNGFIRRPKRKYRRKKAVATIRKHLKAFGTVQVDVKELCDIPSLQEGLWLGKLPSYQYTARDTATGHARGGFFARIANPPLA